MGRPIWRDRTRRSRALLLGLICCAISPAIQADSSDPPHILMVTLCSVRADRLGFSGHDRDTMPTLSRLARESAVFDNAYANATFTVPSHAALLTGRIPSHNGILALGDRLSTQVPTLQEELGRSGYRRLLLTQRTFEFLGDPSSPRGFDGVFPVIDWGTPGAMNWLQTQVQAAEGPVFTLVHIRDAHEPYGAGPPFTQAENREIKALLDGKMRSFGAGAAGTPGGGNIAENKLRNLLNSDESARAEFLALYDSGLYEADQALASVIDTWESTFGWDNTLLVVLADHGELLGEEGHFGHQADLWDAVLHVPLLLRLPSGEGAGEHFSQDVGLLDLTPTLLEAAGAPSPSQLDGRSLMPLFTGVELPPRPVLSQLLFSGPNDKTSPELREAMIFQGVRVHRRLEEEWQFGTEGAANPTTAPPELHETIAWMQSWRSELQAPTLLAERAALSPEEIRRIQREGYWSPTDGSAPTGSLVLSLMVSVTDLTGALTGREIDVVLGSAENNIRRLRNDGVSPDPAPDDAEWSLAMTIKSRDTQVLEVLADGESVFRTEDFHVENDANTLALRIENTDEGWSWELLSDAATEEGQPRPDASKRLEAGWAAGEGDVVNLESAYPMVALSPGDAGAGIWMGAVEVSQGLYRVVTGESPSQHQDCGITCPVEKVSWQDAIRFANQLSTLEGLTPAYTLSENAVAWNREADGYRLPTEAEWTLAALAGEDNVWPSGQSPYDQGWYRQNSGGQTQPIATLDANALGLFDMAGNVWEWTWNELDTPLEEGAVVQSETDSQHMVVGASCINKATQEARFPGHISNQSTARSPFMGFRLVRNRPAESAATFQLLFHGEESGNHWLVVLLTLGIGAGLLAGFFLPPSRRRRTKGR